MPSTGRAFCKGCQGKIVVVAIGDRHVPLDFPASGGPVIAMQTAIGAWHAQYAGPGDPLPPGWNRYAPHRCEQEKAA